jgi:hypothetical protein
MTGVITWTDHLGYISMEFQPCSSEYWATFGLNPSKTERDYSARMEKMIVGKWNLPMGRNYGDGRDDSGEVESYRGVVEH